MSEVMPLQPEQTFAQGRFVLVKRLGRGGMGEVWLARDERLKEPVALKFLPPEIRGDPGALDDLRRETARSHKLSHPNIVRIHDLHEDADGMAFIVMEYIDGPTLAALRLDHPARVLSWYYLRPLVAQLCAALEYAHGERVIHRDLKPANMMVDSRGRLKLADFGIAAVASDSMSRVSVKHSTSGTLPYMSPQQVRGQRPQAADDIYALGATLYELLTSQLPFHSGDITHQVLNEAPEPMEERLAALGMRNDILPAVASLIMACLAKEPGQRPQSARVVAEWIGVELVVKPSTESLAAALFPQGPSRSEAVGSEPAGEERSKPEGDGGPPIVPGILKAGKGGSRAGRIGRSLAAVGIMVVVMAVAIWLRKDIFRRDHSEAPVAAPVPATSSAVMTKGLVAYYPFDGNANDASGNGNHGKAFGASLTTNQFGGANAAYHFDGSAVIDCGHSAVLNLTSQVTLCAWANLHNYPATNWYNYLAFVDKRSSYILGANLNFGVAVTIYNPTSNAWPGFCTGNPLSVDLPLNTWRYLTATYNAQTHDGRIYINGQPRTVQAKPDGSSGWPQAMYAGSDDLLLGNESTGGAAGEGFVGDLEDIRIYDRVLSPAEVQQLFACELQLPDKTPSTATAMAMAAPTTATGTQPPTPGRATSAAAVNKPDWISPEVPKPGADGWVVLFDGKRLYGCSPPAADIASGKVSIQDGCLRLDAVGVRFNLIGRDAVIRARLKKVSGQNCTLGARNDGKGRDGAGWFNGGNFFGIGHHVGGPWKDLASVRTRENYNGFFEMEYRAEGINLTLKADGQIICAGRDDSVIEGATGVGAYRGVTLFQSIEARLLDRH